MKFWQALSFTEVDQLVGLARVCEDVGFHGAFVSDHLCIPEKIASRYLYSEDGVAPFDPSTEWVEPWAAISAMATATERLRFTTSIYIAALRHPLEVAKAVATAQTLSRGRVALGVGAGWMKEEFDILGRDFASRGRQLDELLDVCRKLWAGGMVEHSGDFYAFPRVQQTPAPADRIPILVGGTSPPALRRAARHDGWLSSGNTPEELSDIVATLRRLRAEAGLPEDGFEVLAAVNAPPDPSLFRELEGQGVTGVIHFPLAFSVGPGSSLDAKRAALETYANDVIARC